MNLIVQLKQKLIPVSLLVILASFSLTGCEEGPLEEAGKSLDKTVTDVGNKIEDACEDVKEDVNAKDTDC